MVHGAHNLRAMLVSGALLAVTATALAGSLAAAASPAAGRDSAPTAQTPTPVGAVTSSPAAPDPAGVAPTSVRRVTPVPTQTQLSAASRVRRLSAARPSTKARPHAPARTRSVAKRPTSRGTALQRAVARIPGYSRQRPAAWVLTARYGHYGATDLGRNTIYISPSVPASVLDDVVRHEWSHLLTVRTLGGVSAAIAGSNRLFGGSGMVGVERAADCMARRLGARWTNYTSCSDPRWQRAAADLVAGRRP